MPCAERRGMASPFPSVRRSPPGEQQRRSRPDEAWFVSVGHARTVRRRFVLEPDWSGVTERDSPSEGGLVRRYTFNRYHAPTNQHSTGELDASNELEFLSTLNDWNRSSMEIDDGEWRYWASVFQLMSWRAM